MGLRNHKFTITKSNGESLSWDFGEKVTIEMIERGSSGEVVQTFKGAFVLEATLEPDALEDSGYYRPRGLVATVKIAADTRERDIRASRETRDETEYKLREANRELASLKMENETLKAKKKRLSGAPARRTGLIPGNDNNN